LVVIGMLIPRARIALLARMQTMVIWWDDRWARRLDDAERLLAAKQTAEAERALVALDRGFPARNVRHARDKQRERLLLRLGQAEEALGRKAEALDVYRRLVTFDSLNYLNWYEEGSAAKRLAAAEADSVLSKDSFARSLRLMPSHLASLRGYLDYLLVRKQSAPVVQAYERYLDAYLTVQLEGMVGADSAGGNEVAIDGRPELAVFQVAVPPGGNAELVVTTKGFSAALDSVVLIAPARVGTPGGAERRAIPPSAVRTDELEPLEGGRFRARSDRAAFRIPLGGSPNGVVRVELGLRLFKPIEADLWTRIADSYRQLGRSEQLAASSARTLGLATAADADLVLSRLEWARQGRLLKPDERAF
jgi:tetratricopeptide (TPR) repeat protein